MITEKKLKNIGLYLGSFNPIHIGHMAIANYVANECGLDEVWLLPSPLNPLKTQKDLLPYDLRCEMIAKAIGDDPRFKLNLLEQRLPSPHFTVHTLQALTVLYPECKFFLIVGGDNWTSFKQWHAYSRIMLSWDLIVYPRPKDIIDKSALPHSAIYLEDAPLFDISASTIREAYLKGKDLRHWLPNPEYWNKISALQQSQTSREDLIDS